jgi:hypothetical protein
MTEEKHLPAPDWFDPKKILLQVIDGKKTEEIANTLGTSKDRLTFYLRKHAPTDWIEAQIIRELRRKDEAEDDIDNANDAIQLNKAIAKLKSAQWSLERVYRRVYGDVKETPSEKPIQINIALRRFGDPEPRIIDQE